MKTDSIVLRSLLAAMAAAAAISVAGCGMGSVATTSPTSMSIGSIKGVAHGGEQPITGATVTLWETQSNGYGGLGVPLNTTFTDAYGNFLFAGSYTCDPAQQAYITAQGGNSGANGTNNQILLMAALGPCGSVNSGTFIIINEVTTVAAAYGLSGFTTTSGTDVNVSAPANNNAATGTTTAAAGLAHAFLNAANLASTTNGQANTAITSNSAQATQLNGIVPAAEINALANSLQACVNSNGGSATSTTVNDGTNCGILFSSTPSMAGAIPTNTLQAVLNLAQNPYPSAAAVTAIYNLGPGAAAFQPSLAAAPLDWDVAITYKLLSYPTNCFTPPCEAASYPYHLALDANDNVYVTNPNDSAGAANVGINLYGIASNGALLYVNNSSFPASTSASASVAVGARNIAADALGNLWVADNSTSVFELVASTGNPNTGDGGSATGAFSSPNTSVIGVAVDASNNVWLGSARTSGANVTKIPYNGSNTWGTPVSIGQAVNGSYAVSADANQNIWFSGEFSTGTTDSVLPNQNAGTANPPSYGTTFLSTTLNSGTTPYGVAVDAAGNVWSATTAGTQALNEVTPTLTSGVITSLSSPASYNTGAGFGSPRYDEVDGGGMVWIAENTNKGIIGFNTSTLAFTTESQGLKPCLVVAATTKCGAEGSAGAISGVRMVAIDSTGSIWSPSSTYGTVVQIIGSASPTWPLLSMGKPATKPQ